MSRIRLAAVLLGSLLAFGGESRSIAAPPRKEAGTKPAAAAASLAPAANQKIDFVRDIRPILQRSCYRCHGPEKQKSGYRLDVRSIAMTGGDAYAPNILSGKAADSPLLRFVAGLDDDVVMPPEGKRLPASEVGLLRAWIEQGAVWPDEAAGKEADKLDWWSLKPLVSPPLPSGDSTNPIDAFVEQTLREKHFPHAPEADRRTLIRRLYFDLNGLPPTPDEVAAFVADRDSAAYEHLVDHLLDSPRYGERWARHWMDVAHFAETHGHDQDGIRENAWPYRDYLIASFNADKPYSRFVEEQVAGDALFPDDPQATVALGFLAAGPWDESSLRSIQENTLDRQIARYVDRDDIISNVMNNFASATVQCARCHDHKFDPISQQDYYALQADFAGVDKTTRAYDADPAIGRRRRDLMRRKQLLNRDNAESKSVAHELAALPKPSLVYAAGDFEAEASHVAPHGPRPVEVLHRGDILQPRGPAVPGSLSCVPALEARFKLAHPNDEAERRAALARWLTDPRNPLTWRSIVNRVWQYHFGRGLVETPNDFGRMGALPTHPELLDWLAVRFRDHGQSIKQLNRLIVTSKAYRQSSRIADIGAAQAAGAVAADVDNRFLWRMNRQRLDAECVRDAVLSISGRLDLRMGGPSDRQFEFKPRPMLSPIVDYSSFDLNSDAGRRRSVYRFLFRSLPDPFMQTLDCPSGDEITPVRTNSVTVQQALALWNDAFIARHCEYLAARLETMGSTNGARVEAAVQLVFGRPAQPDELADLTAYAERHGLANLCRVLFNASDFLFVN